MRNANSLVTHSPLRTGRRCLMAASCLTFSLLLSACGGGSGASDGSRLEDKVDYPDQTTEGSENSSSSSSSSSSVDSGANSSSASSEPEGGETEGSSSSSSSSVEGGGEPEPTPEPEPDSSSSSSSASSTPTEGDDGTDISGAVRLEWDVPDERENGEYLELYELGGYELRYRVAGSDDHQTVILEEGDAWFYEIDGLEGSYEFTIAAFDSNGLYSEFVPLSPISIVSEVVDNL